MKKFTKLLSLLLAVVMMLGLAACGSNGTTETAAPTAADVSGAVLPPARPIRISRS